MNFYQIRHFTYSDAKIIDATISSRLRPLSKAELRSTPVENRVTLFHIRENKRDKRVFIGWVLRDDALRGVGYLEFLADEEVPGGGILAAISPKRELKND